MRTFQDLILTLQRYWSERGCVLLQPYDMEVGAGTSHTATFLRALGPEPWKAAYDVYHQNEVEQSAYNFEHSNVDFLLMAFSAHESTAKKLMEQQLALPAYEQVLKAAHTFNLLDARGAISVTERAAYIGRIRGLARSVAASYLDSRARLGFPMAPREWADEVLAKREAVA
ncbi:MAG: glycine--tRNA ligase subunit alpha [Betaproteobacteria bacterium]|nr:glycine--tRNA ligase subunit alpha [Betaproteobacteria bacterium]